MTLGVVLEVMLLTGNSGQGAIRRVRGRPWVGGAPGLRCVRVRARDKRRSLLR